MRGHALCRGAFVPYRPLTRPANHPLPALYRLCPAGPEETILDTELGRDGPLAMVEAALFAADEPLPPRRLAVIARLKDANEARRLVLRLANCTSATAVPFKSRRWRAASNC